MSVIRRSFFMLALALALPAALQAQFGGLGKLLDKAKAKVDSAKSTVDSAQVVVDSGKATVHEAANLGNSTPAKGKAGDGQAGKGGSAASASGGSSRGASKAAAGTATTPAGSNASASTATNGARKSNATNSSSSAATPSASAGPRTQAGAQQPTPAAASGAGRSGPAITEAVYQEFARGYSVESAFLKANPNDPQAAMNAAVTASGLSTTDYVAVKGKVLVYEAYAGREDLRASNPLLTASDIVVLDAHKSDLAKLTATPGRAGAAAGATK